jgi:FtsP/CotA-like multicopper oxidase with cupredoxin domain
MQHSAMTGVSTGATEDDPCNGVMTTASSNVHFHGLNVPAICHQDEVVHTLVNPGDPAFRYRLRIPPNEPPGLYWYHPHPHGITQLQVMGGASGAIIIEGIEKIKPEVAGLTERVFVVRDQLVPGGGDADAGNLSINFVPSTYPATKAPIIQMKPLEKQFWRVVNASGQKFQALQLLIDGTPESLEVVSMDGVPLKTNLHTKSLLLPPAGRAEFIVQAPAEGVQSDLITLNVNTGPDGDPNPQHQLASIVATAGASPHHETVPAKVGSLGPRRFDGLAETTPRIQRKLYFSEDLSDPDNPRFFITVDGATPKQFDPDEPPAIITQQGTTEDWTIENRSGEMHAFHMHQIHFLVMAVNGVPVQDQNIQDTVKVLAWDGVSATFPNVKIRMDFRYPESVGTYVYHCHILDHEDGGMMAKIEVDPAK